MTLNLVVDFLMRHRFSKKWAIGLIAHRHSAAGARDTVERFLKIPNNPEESLKHLYSVGQPAVVLALIVSSPVVLLGLIAFGTPAGVPGALAALPLIAAYPIVERIWRSKYVGSEAVAEHKAKPDPAHEVEGVARRFFAKLYGRVSCGHNGRVKKQGR